MDAKTLIEKAAGIVKIHTSEAGRMFAASPQMVARSILCLALSEATDEALAEAKICGCAARIAERLRSLSSQIKETR